MMYSDFKYKNGDLVRFIEHDTAAGASRPIGSATLERLFGKNSYCASSKDVGTICDKKLSKDGFVMYQIYVNNEMMWFFEENIVTYDFFDNR